MTDFIDALTRHEMLRRELASKRPFEDYIDQPDTATRKRLAEFDRIPFALPPKKEDQGCP